MQLRRSAAAALCAALLLLGSCADDGDGGGNAASSASTTTAAPTTTARPAIQRPDGPAAKLSGEVRGGNGVFLGEVGAGTALEDAGYEEHEYVASGTATSYAAPDGLPQDGRFALEVDAAADYAVRVVVRRPSEPTDFNGTVVVEWLNVSGGVDANPDYGFMAEELLRGGYAWVGVSAQRIGIEGGAVAVGVEGTGDLAGKGLKALDPERYGDLSHPGDAFAYDIYTQIGRALRSDGGSGALGELTPDRLLAVGESQSAFMLTTYVNGVQPLTKVFDGFLIHSRGGAPAPLGDGTKPIDIVSAITGKPTVVRTDTEVPVLIVESETDVTSILGYYPARQDDTDRVRLWEIAGTAHADAHLLGPLADSLECGAPINDGPQHFVIKAALRALDQWVRTEVPPAPADRLEVTEVDGKPVITRDEDGIALGGIRTPIVDVPVAAQTGEPGSEQPSVICLLMGSSTPLPEDRLVELHTDRAGYLAAFEAATDAAVAAGFVLGEDRAAMLEAADPDRLPA